MSKPTDKTIDKPAESALAAARDAASEFVTLSSKLSDRLVALEKYLGSRPATVRAEVRFHTDEREHTLWWTRNDGVWRLFVSDVPVVEERVEYDENAGEGTLTGINFRQLSQCTVDVKLAAAEVIPTILEKINGGELKTIERLKAVHAKLDQISKGLGLAPMNRPEGA